jgi:uncharacterized membrane protein YdjX (TVP38/TMEM64 family)
VPKKATKKADYFSIIVTVLTFAVSIYIIKVVGDNSGILEHWIRSAGVFGPLITILLYGVLSLTPIPSDPLSLLCGALFGPWVGIFTSWMGNNFAAIIEYYVGKSVSTVAAFDARKKELPLGLNKLPVDSVWFLMGARLVPGFGSKVVSVLAGVYNVGLWRYTWTAAVTNLFGSVMYSVWGTGLLLLLK